MLINFSAKQTMISAMMAMKEDRREWKCPFFLACLNENLFCGAGQMAH